MTWISSAVISAVLALSSADAKTAPRYIVTDLGCASGERHGAPLLALAASINEKGQVVGFIDSGEHTRAFLWEDGRRTFLTAPDETYTAVRINDRGQIVICHIAPPREESSTHAPAPRKNHAFLLDDGKMIDLGISHVHDMNNRGQVLGTTEIDGEDRLVLWESGRLTDLSRRGVTGRVSTFGYALNDRGQIVGTCDRILHENPGLVTFRGFLWDEGQITYLGDDVTPAAINNRGHIIGTRREAGSRVLFLREGEAFRTLGTLDKKPHAVSASAINGKGQVVGVEWLRAGGRRALLWEGGVRLDLNHLIAADSGWTLEMAKDINDRGQIVGAGHLGGMNHAFLLTPKTP